MLYTDPLPVNPRIPPELFRRWLNLESMEVFQFLMPIFTEYGYLAVFVMLLICGFGVPVPEDVTLVTGGVIAGLGHADVNTMFAVGMAGVMVGDGLMFTLGRLYGERISKLPGFPKMLSKNTANGSCSWPVFCPACAPPCFSRPA